MSRSSFARSFFQSASETELDEDAAIAAAAAAIGGNDDGATTTTSSDRNSGLERRKSSRRRLSRGSRGSGRDLLRNSGGSSSGFPPRQNSGHTAASSASGGSDSKNFNEPAMPPRPEPAKRQNSWYQDALLQSGGSSDLAAILGEDVAPPVDDGVPVINDEEVLEQYRIMAHVEASIRVKENTGFDMSDYEKRRKSFVEPNKGEYYTGKQAPKPKLPSPKRVIPGNSSQNHAMKPQEPPLPVSLINPSLTQKACISRRVPELCPGIVMQGSAVLPKGEHAVRCLGCQTKLRVNLLAMLVQCPDCSTVSPASSTRR